MKIEKVELPFINDIVEQHGKQAAMEYAYEIILKAIGEDPSREGLLDTPKRATKMMLEMTQGMNVEPKDFLKVVFEADQHKELVLVKDIPFFSSCEHHLATVIGHAHIAYIPNGKVVGLSKLARLVEGYARRLQIQERMTAQIADALMEVLAPEGCAVMLDAQHMCMSARGINKPGTSTTTIAVRGTFLTDHYLEQKFLTMVGVK